jgi:hypothetical protein
MLEFLQGSSGCDLLLSSEVEHGDYHKNINAKMFEKCSQHQVNNVPFVFTAICAFITQIVSFVFDFVRFSFIVDTPVSNSQTYAT